MKNNKGDKQKEASVRKTCYTSNNVVTEEKLNVIKIITDKFIAKYR